MSRSAPHVVLAVSQQRDLLRGLADVLRVFHYDVVGSADPAALLRTVELVQPQICLIDAADWQELRKAVSELRTRTAGAAPVVILLVESLPPIALCEALDAGVDDILQLPLRNAELLSRLRTAARLGEFNRRLAKLVPIDPQTQLLSEAGLLACERTWQPPGIMAAVLLLEIDFHRERARHFDPQAPQHLLAAATRIRQQAEAKSALAAHLGEGRFAMVLPQAGPAEAQQCAEQLRRAVADGVASEEGITCSVGVAAGARGEEGLGPLLQRAECALKTAQDAGRNCVAGEQDFAAERARWQECVERGNPFAHNLARDVMTPFTFWLTPGDSLQKMRSAFARTSLPLIPIVQTSGRLAGILLPERSAGSQPEGSAGDDATVDNWMTQDFLRLPADAEYGLVMRHFFEKNREPVVILDRERPLGYITFQSFALVASEIRLDSFRSDGAGAPARVLLVPDVPRPADASSRKHAAETAGCGGRDG